MHAEGDTVNSVITLDDTLDSRRELHTLLGKLPPRERIAFLEWACKQVPQNEKGYLPVPRVGEMQTTCDMAYRCDRADLRLTNEVYFDLLQLAATYHLDLLKAAVILEKLARNRR